MQETLLLKEQIDGGECRLVLVGWIDSGNSFLLEQWLEANLDKGYKRIIFDCASLQFISSAGIRVFLAAIRRIGELNDCNLAFANINDSVMGVLNVTGMHKLITVIDA